MFMLRKIVSMSQEGIRGDEKSAWFEVLVTDKSGFHAKPISQFVQLASQFTDTEIWIANKAREDELLNAKNIMQVLMLAAAKGTTLLVSAEGPQAKKAAKALLNLLIEEKIIDG